MICGSANNHEDEEGAGDAALVRDAGEGDVIGDEDDVDGISRDFGEVLLFGDLEVVEVALIVHGDDEDGGGARFDGLENGRHVGDGRGDE